MANQIVVSAGAKVRNLQDVIIGTSGVLTSLGFDVANGVPRLDVNGKILVSQLPNSVMEYKGTWSAATNTPTLVNGTGNQGDVYLCNVAGTVNFGAGPIAFVVGDQVIYSGSIWQRASGATGTVTSVAVTESGDSLNITGSPITTSGTINIGFNGTNLQYVNGAGNLTTFPTLITSIGLSMPSAFSVANSPLTANGTIAVTGAGVASQYIRGDGTLADFPSSGGGGSSVSYYLNGGTSQGTIGGTTYYEMSKTAVIGTGVDFTKTGDGFIVAFLTDANDPAQLNIPAGNWNYEIYASMSSNGGTPEMYAELYVYDGTTFTLISTSPHEILYDGTALNLYTFAMAVPATSLTLTDRLAVKLYATNSGGKTTTIHTQDSHLCQIITTFSTGITALNGLTAQVQYFQTGASGTDFNISSTTATHTFNIPDASATARGLITTGTQTIAGAKTFSGLTSFTNTSGINLQYGAYINKGNTPLAFSSNNTNIYSDATTNNIVIRDNLSIAKLEFNNSTQTFTFPNATGTIALTSDLTGGTVTSVAALTLGTSGTDLSSSVATGTTTPVITLNVPTASAANRGALSSTDWTTFNNKQGTITLTTTGTSGVATLIANTLNIPDYGSALTGYVTLATTQTITGAKTFSAALSGTSATFSGNVVLGTTALSGGGAAQWLTANGTSYGGGFISSVSGVAKAYYYYDNSGYAYVQGTLGVGVKLIANNVDALTIASTGVATFSSSVTATAFIPSGATVPTNGMYLSAANTLNFATNTTNRLTINSSGNLGLGVTPSAWVDYKVLQFGGGSISSYTDNLFMEVTQNAFWNGSSYVYVNNGFASRYQQNVGRHEWYQAPTGTAGAAITFTQAMTLDASGRLGIGNTNMSSFDGNANQLVVGTGSANQGITIYASTSTESSLYFADGTGASSYRGYIFYNHAQDLMAIGSNGARTMTLFNSNNVAIGTTTDAGYKLDVNGTGRFSGNVTVGQSVTPTLSIGNQTGDVGTVLRFVGNNTYKNHAIVSNGSANGSLDFYRSTTNGGTTFTTPDLTIASTGAATFSSTLGIGGVADSVKGGTYTPTINTTTNIASSSVGTWQYLRVGNTVTVSGSITITPTSGVTTTSFNFSLPINSTFASGNDCAGTGVDYNATTYLMVNGNSGAANFGLGLFKSTTTSAMTLSIQFTYQII